MPKAETAAPKPAEPDDAAEKVHDPVHRVSYSFRREGADLWVHSWFEPGGHLPGHFHPTLTEHWEAAEGSIRFKLDGRWRDLRPEDGPVPVPPTARHEVKNESGRVVRTRTRVVPAGNLQEFLVESARAAHEGLYNSRNLPTSWAGLKWLAAFAHRHRHEVVTTSPPPALQRLTLPLLARLAR